MALYNMLLLSLLLLLLLLLLLFILHSRTAVIKPREPDLVTEPPPPDHPEFLGPQFFTWTTVYNNSH